MGTDKNLEIGDFSIYHLAGFSGVLHGYTWLLSIPNPWIFPPTDQVRHGTDISVGKRA